MESVVSITEAEVDNVKRKVGKIYAYYGIDADGMDEGDLATVYKYYLNNKEQLDIDYEESKRYAGRFDEDDII